jgi:hypothetical protein
MIIDDSGGGAAGDSSEGNAFRQVVRCGVDGYSPLE